MLEFVNVTGVSKKFKLENISFTAPTGYITGITGVNGAGKTTLFHYIVDRKCNYTGQILYNGEDIRTDFEKLQNRIGFISDEKRFFTAGESSTAPKSTWKYTGLTTQLKSRYGKYSGSITI